MALDLLDTVCKWYVQTFNPKYEGIQHVAFDTCVDTVREPDGLLKAVTNELPCLELHMDRCKESIYFPAKIFYETVKKYFPYATGISIGVAGVTTANAIIALRKGDNWEAGKWGAITVGAVVAGIYFMKNTVNA